MSPTPTSITVPTSGGTLSVPVVTYTGSLDEDTILAIQSATAAALVQFYNRGVQARYDAAVKSYNEDMASGSFPHLVVPAAPLSFIYLPGDATTPGSWSQTGPPVVPTVPLATVNNANIAPTKPIVGKIHVGAAIKTAPGWFSVGQDDGFPAGQTTPPVTTEEGVTGLFQKWGAPIGAGWYLKVG